MPVIEQYPELAFFKACLSGAFTFRLCLFLAAILGLPHDCAKLNEPKTLPQEGRFPIGLEYILCQEGQALSICSYYPVA